MRIVKVTMIVIAVVGIAAISGRGYQKWRASGPPPSASDSAEDQNLALIEHNKDLLGVTLQFPDAVQFRDTRVSHKSGHAVVCGEVNTKNTFGAYTGFQRWIGDGSVGQFLEVDVKDFREMWAEFC